jgi:hypothetical protein
MSVEIHFHDIHLQKHEWLACQISFDLYLKRILPQAHHNLLQISFNCKALGLCLVRAFSACRGWSYVADPKHKQRYERGH